MKNILKKILLLCLTLLPMFIWYTNAANWIAPSYDDNFATYFTSNEEFNWSVIKVFKIDWVSSEKTLEQNIRCLFFPSTIAPTYCNNGWYRGWAIWNVIRYIWYALVVLFIVISWIKLLVSGSNADKVKSSLSSLLYIILWSILLFWCIRILWSVLKFETVRWTDDLTQNLQWNEHSLLFFVLSFAKAFAFIAAILMIVIHWFKMMSNSDKSDKVKEWLKWLLNIIIALVIIKVIDYIYYMAQLPNLVSEATTLIIEIAKILWFIIWALMIIMLFYAGILYITDQWSGEKMKKATNIIVWILVTALVIFSLLLIIYEIFREFA